MENIGAVEKRRQELWVLSLSVVLVLSTAVILLSIFLNDNLFYPFTLGLLTILFALYMADTERRHREIIQNLRREQLLELEQESEISQLHQRLREMSALYRSVEAIGLEKDPHKVLDIILRAAVGLSGASQGAIMLLDTVSHTLRVLSSTGVGKESDMKRQDELWDGIEGWVIKTGKPLLLSRTAKTTQFRIILSRHPDLTSAVCIPLRVGEKCAGVLTCLLINAPDRSFTEYDVKVLSIFARYASLTLSKMKAQGK